MSRNQSKMNKEKQIFENQISLILREDKTLEIYVGDSLAAEISDGRLDMEFVKKGESGFYRTDIQGGKPSETNALVNEMNEKLGLSKGQAEAMKAGSMFGWDTPAADPKSYDKNGIPVKPKQKDYER